MTTPDAAPDLIFTVEAAALLGVHRTHFTRHIVGKGLIAPVKRQGGKTGPMLFDRRDVEALKALASS